jgi:PAS domain S-box-containing protein
MDPKILRSILDGVLDPIIIKTENEFAWLNSAACKLFAIESPNELIGKSILEPIHPDYRDFSYQEIDSSANSELVEYKIIRLDGSEVWVESKSEPVTYKEKKGSLVFLRDITQRKATEQALKDSEERMRFALETSSIGVWELDLDNHITKRSLMHDKIFGYTSLQQVWTYSIFLRHVHPDDQEFIKKKFKSVPGFYDDWNLEFRIIRADGQIRWVWVSGRLTSNEKGKFRRIIGVIQDITQRKTSESRLHSNYNLLRIAGEYALFGGWSYDLENQTLKWSDAVADIHDMPRGYSPSLAEGMSYYAPGWQEKISKVFYDCIERGTSYDEELEIITGKGNRKWIRTLAEAVIENGKIVKVQGAFQDITKAKQAEKELKENEEKFRNLFDEHAAVKLIIDPDNGDIIDANKAAADFYGWTKDELKNMNISQINTLSKEEVQKELIKARTQPKIYYNFQHRKANGEIRDVEVFSSKISIQGKLFQHSIIHDVTEKIQTQKKLNLLSRSVEQSPVSIMITGINGDIEYVNPHFEFTTGYTLDEVRNRNPRFLKSSYQQSDVYQNLWKTILAGKDWTGELINKKKNGDIYWERVAISPILNAQGMVTNFVSVREDITEHKILVENLMLAKEKAEESDRLKLAFLANISHEIRTPMNGVLGFAQLLKEPGLSRKKQQCFIDIIEKSGHRMLDTVNDLVDIAKIESGQVQLQISATNLGHQLKNLYDFFLPQTNEKGLKLSFIPSPETCDLTIKTDPNKLDSILSNLIKNAIKFTDKGKIEFGCSIKENKLKFYISDTGIGIQKNKHQTIFNRFEQADTNDIRSYHGSGLGLAIAKAYVELLGGKIWLKSSPGRGSTFFFTIEYTKAQNTQHIVLPAGNAYLTEGIPQLSGKTILFAEDDLYSREMVTYLIRKTGANILIAFDGAQALNCLKKNEVDLVLLDIRLPQVNGYAVLEEIRKTLPDLPVIAQSAFAFADDIRMFREFGFTDYLTKPINPDVLYDVLARYLTENNSFNDHTALTGTQS